MQEMPTGAENVEMVLGCISCILLMAGIALLIASKKASDANKKSLKASGIGLITVAILMSGSACFILMAGGSSGISSGVGDFADMF